MYNSQMSEYQKYDSQMSVGQMIVGQLPKYLLAIKSQLE